MDKITKGNNMKPNQDIVQCYREGYNDYLLCNWAKRDECSVTSLQSNSGYRLKSASCDLSSNALKLVKNTIQKAEENLMH
ncbi:hypothetical protein GJ496_010540 [Pomphorhynchus laevis]|nr:hypothetical protein GJ496_010540 [Pomphorhynchus laevis]